MIIRFSKKYNKQTFISVSNLLKNDSLSFDKKDHDRIVEKGKKIFIEITELVSQLSSSNNSSMKENILNQLFFDNMYFDENDENKKVIMHIVEECLMTFNHRLKKFPLILQSKFNNEIKIEKANNYFDFVCDYISLRLI